MIKNGKNARWVSNGDRHLQVDSDDRVVSVILVTGSPMSPTFTIPRDGEIPRKEFLTLAAAKAEVERVQSI